MFLTWGLKQQWFNSYHIHLLMSSYLPLSLVKLREIVDMNTTKKKNMFLFEA